MKKDASGWLKKAATILSLSIAFAVSAQAQKHDVKRTL